MSFVGCEKNNKQNSLLSHEEISLTEVIKHSNAPIYPFRIIRTYSHDAQNFTEGLVLDNAYIFESSGLYQQSKLQKKNFQTGKIIIESLLPPQYFAEGIAIIGNFIYQITYKEHTGFIYDKNTLQLKNIFYYSTEGWGLTSDGKYLIMSNGSDTLFFIDPHTFALKRKIVVKDKHQSIPLLNELEYIQGKIYANIWSTDMIAIISPATGNILGWINIESLNKPENCSAISCASNGIAYDEKNHTLFITGKNWSYMYEIKLTR